MQINITGHHVDITPPLRAYVTEKMQRLARHFDRVTSVNVILNVEKLDHMAEATVNAGGRTPGLAGFPALICKDRARTGHQKGKYKCC